MENNRGKQLLIVALSFINMLCMPILSYHRGLFPSDAFNAFEMLDFSAGDYRKFALMLLVPTIGLLAFALINSADLFKLSSLVGIVWCGFNIITKAADEGFDTILSEETSIGIGAWLGLALFVWGFISTEFTDNSTPASEGTNAAGGATAPKAGAAKPVPKAAPKAAAPKATAPKTTTSKTATPKAAAPKQTVAPKTAAKPAAAKPAAAPKKKRCPICGTVNEATATNCSHCNIVL